MGSYSSIVLPFIGINIIIEVIEINKHIILSLISWFILLSLTIILMIKYREVLSLKFILKVDQDVSIYFTSLIIIKSVLHILLFLINSNQVQFVIYLLEILVLSIITIIFFIFKAETTLFQIYTRLLFV